MLAALAAILFEFHFVGGVDLVFFGYVVLGFTDRTNKGKELARTFFGHIPLKRI